MHMPYFLPLEGTAEKREGNKVKMIISAKYKTENVHRAKLNTQRRYCYIWPLAQTKLSLAFPSVFLQLLEAVKLCPLSPNSTCVLF